MGRRYRRSSSGKALGQLMYAMIMLCVYAIYFAIKLIIFFVEMIIFYASGYKKKSGNGFWKTYFDKGCKGEYNLYKKVKRKFGEEKVLTNLYLPSKNVDNTEIDVLAVCDGIIYCFEMKNYSGYIYGREKDRNWTQVLKYRTKNQFYNPIRQNYAHKKALEEYLQIDSSKIEPIVVFSNRANLTHVERGFSNMIRIRDVSKMFKIENLNYSSGDDEKIIEKLTSRTLMNEYVKKEHIEQVNSLKC